MLKLKQKNISQNPLVSIVILVYNAPLLTLQTLLTLKRTKNVDYEVVVVDNASNIITKLVLQFLFRHNYIDKLVTSDENTFFAKGNNIGTSYADEKSRYYLLLNSDIKIIDPDWLYLMVKEHQYGISSIGICDKDKLTARCDGYCFLIDKDLYDKYKLDENYKWWYGITKLQVQVLSQKDCFVGGCEDDSTLIKHYWGGSGKAYKKVLKRLPHEDLESWFDDTVNKFKVLQKYKK